MKKAVFAAVAAAMVFAVANGWGDTGARSVLEDKLRDSIVKKLDFRDAALRDVVAFLSQVSGDEFNILIKADDASMPPTVTMSLANVPLYDVLRYVCEVTESELRVDEHAVVIALGRGTPANTYGVKLKVAPVEGVENQFVVEFRISEKASDGKENLLSAPKIMLLAGNEGVIKVVDDGERNGVICTATVTPKEGELRVDTLVTIKRDGKVLWSCSQETTVVR